jgi:hypothetical protein
MFPLLSILFIVNSEVIIICLGFLVLNEMILRGMTLAACIVSTLWIFGGVEIRCGVRDQEFEAIQRINGNVVFVVDTQHDINKIEGWLVWVLYKDRPDTSKEMGNSCGVVIDDWVRVLGDHGINTQDGIDLVLPIEFVDHASF